MIFLLAFLLAHPALAQNTTPTPNATVQAFARAIVGVTEPTGYVEVPARVKHQRTPDGVDCYWLAEALQTLGGPVTERPVPGTFYCQSNITITDCPVPQATP